MSSSNSNAPSTPFEWLSGGLFFGKGDRGSNAGIDSCKDVSSLLKGMNENLEAFLQAPPATAAVESDTAVEEEGPREQASKFLAARLSRLRFLLYDERRASSQDGRRGTPTVASDTVEGLTGNLLGHLMPSLLSHLCQLDFESRKHVAAIYNYLLVCGLDGSDAGLYSPIMLRFISYVETNYDKMLSPIVVGHDCSTGDGPTPDVALHCGTMYRSSLRHCSLYQQLVTSTARVKRYVFPFLDKYVHFPNFDVASDAMESLKLVLTGGDDRVDDEAMAELASQFLTRDYKAIFDERFNPKLLSPESNYMTRRMALQILSTILLTRSNYNVMIRYIASKSNLMRIMLLLRDTSPHITLDAFHVFKIFVANPNKPPDIVKILSDNKVKLCKYLETLHKDREATDAQFRDEKALVISTLETI